MPHKNQSGPQQWFFGWAVLLAVTYSLFIGAGAVFYAMSVLLRAIIAETGFSVAQISTATTIFLTTGGLAGIAIGELISRYDARYVVSTGSVIIVMSFWLLPEISSLTSIYFTYILLGLGYSMTALVPATTIVARWFVRRRALAIALTQSGLSLGGILLTPILANMLDTNGLEALRHPYLLAAILFNIPLVILLMRPSPQSMGQHPDGDKIASADDNPHNMGLLAAQALRSRFFLWCALAAICTLLVQVGTIAHIYNWGLERANPSIAAITVASLAFSSMIGRLVCGFILHRINLFYFALSIYSIQAIAALGIAMAQGTMLVLVATICFGITVGNGLMAQPLLIGAAFGGRDFARILSYHQLVMNIGVAAGPVIIGVIYDYGDGYRTAFLTMSLISLCAVGALYRAGAPEQVAKQAAADI